MGKLAITITVDWDAYDTLDGRFVVAGLSGISAFHENHPDVSVTHFVCPAYFTRGEDRARKWKEAFATALTGVRYELGLHIHSYKTLVIASGVGFRSTPSYHGDEEGGYAAKVGTIVDPGHGVPLGAYGRADIDNIVAKSTEVLLTWMPLPEVQSRLWSFRCGGWLATDDVLAAVAAAGFKYDASAADGNHFRGLPYDAYSTGGCLSYWLGKMWGSETQGVRYLRNSTALAAYPLGIRIRRDDGASSPIGIKRAQPQYILPGLVEVPDTGLLADYTSLTQMKDHIDRAAAVSRTRSQDTFIGLGFHLESSKFDGPEGGMNYQNVSEAVQYAKDRYTAQVRFPPIRASGEDLDQRVQSL